MQNTVGALTGLLAAAGLVAGTVALMNSGGQPVAALEADTAGERRAEERHALLLDRLDALRSENRALTQRLNRLDASVQSLADRPVPAAAPAAVATHVPGSAPAPVAAATDASLPPGRTGQAIIAWLPPQGVPLVQEWYRRKIGKWTEQYRAKIADPVTALPRSLPEDRAAMVRNWEARVAKWERQLTDLEAIATELALAKWLDQNDYDNAARPKAWQLAELAEQLRRR